jgi:hypothetical protein
MHNTAAVGTHTSTAVDQLLRRIQSEFLEMPGLRLTSRQAQRLWNLDMLVCESLLAALVDVRFLVEQDGVFLQRTDASRRLSSVARRGVAFRRTQAGSR